MRDLAVRNQLRSGLASLPKPKDTDWEFEIPEDQLEVAQDDDMPEEDAAERDRRERERKAAEDELERRRRTQVMQRDLPRPLTVDLASLLKKAERLSNPAEVLISREAASLMANDAAKYPLPGSQVKGRPAPLSQMEDNSLADARLLILAETQALPNFEEIQGMFEGRAETSTLLGLGCYGDDEKEQETIIRAAFDVSTSSSSFLLPSFTLEMFSLRLY